MKRLIQWLKRVLRIPPTSLEVGSDMLAGLKSGIKKEESYEKNTPKQNQNPK